MDESACNYNSEAVVDDGSCTYAAEGLDCDGACLVGELLTMNDSYGDGWNGAALTINGVDYTMSGSSESVCVDVDLSGCVIMSWTPGAWDGETSWSFAGQEGSGGSAPSNMGECVTGCTDANATNYNADADISDDSCEYAATPGCMDESACNFSADAQIDDGSCDYPAANYDCEGNCLATAVVAGGGSYPGEVFWSLTDCAGDVILEGGAPFEGCADVSGGYSVLMGDTYGDGWNGNTLSVGDASYTIEVGASGSDLASCAVPGCTDETAENYDAAANSDDGSCEYAQTPGCMDESACNYNADAEVDDASCTYPAEGLDCEGNCLSGVAVTAGGGSWISEIGWVISACDGTEILSGGGAEFSGCADVSGGYSVSMTDAYGDGWNGNILTVGDASYTIEVGAEASDLASCAVPGCTDETADNYNADANVDDDSCEYAIPQGCTDASACNFDAVAQEDDGSCTYAAEGFDCAGNCLSGELLTMNDSWGDGWNGAVLTINGVDYTVAEGSSATACVDLAACNTVSWTAGSYDSETSWSVGDLSGEAGSGTGEFGDCVVRTATVEFTVDMNVVDGSKSRLDNVVVNGSWNGWQG